MARHRHARFADRGRPLHRDTAEAAGPRGCVPGGNCVPPALDRRRAGVQARSAAREERVRAIPQESTHGSSCMAIQVTATTLPEVKIIEPKVFGDARGFFYESFNGKEFAEQVEAGIEFVQDNHSRSA